MSVLNFGRTLRHTVLALLLAGAASVAAAATYHVDIDTSAYAGTGYLDLSFIAGNSDAAAATATVSNFSGALGALMSQDGDVSGTLAGTASFGNGSFYNDVYHAVTLGGLFSFDVDFSGSFLSASSNSGTTFAVGLLDATQGAYLGAEPALLTFELASNNGVTAAGVTPTTFSSIATIRAVSAVPEPSAWLLLLGGVAVVLVSARRRRRDGAFQVAPVSGKTY